MDRLSALTEDSRLYDSMYRQKHVELKIGLIGHTTWMFSGIMIVSYHKARVTYNYGHHKDDDMYNWCEAE